MGLLLVATAATSAVAATAGSASAAPAATYVNDLVRDWGPGAFPAYGLCLEYQRDFNQQRYGNPNGSSDQYYYCTSRSDGGANLWWRHSV